MVGNGWASGVGGHVGKHPSDGNAKFRFGVHIGDSGSPAGRRGYTEEITVTTNMDNGGNGTRVEGAFVETTQAYSPLDTAMALYDGERYAIDALPTGGNRLQHGMFPAASINEAYEDFYEQTGLSIPPDPFNETSATNQGWMTLWIVYDPNEAPLVPINRTPGGTITDVTPHLMGDFRDPNAGDGGTNRGDYMKQFQVQVETAGGTPLWDSTQNASSEEIANKRFDTIYAGTPLAAGNSYKWRCRTRDFFDTWGPWSDYLNFDIPGTGSSSPGVLTLDGTPTGNNNALTGLTFQGRYNHSTGVAMDQVQVELYQGATLVDSSGTLSKSVASSAAPGTLFNVTQSEAGFTLVGGIEYSYRMRARSTNGLWSSWTSKRTFKTGSAPFQPSNLDPSGSEGVVALPLLQCQMTDPDGFVGLTCNADIMSKLNVNNESFNGNVTNWAAVNAAGVTAALSYDAAIDQDLVGGSGKLNISASTAASGVIVTRARNDRVYPVIAGASYYVQGYVRTDQANLWGGVFIDWFSDIAGTTYLSTSSFTEAGTINTFILKTLTATAPASALSAKVGFCAKSNAANQLGNIWGDFVATTRYDVRYRRAMTHQGSGLWTYQTTSTDLPGFATYHWRARGFDGVLFSAYSDEVEFIYRAGPVVTMLTPTANQVIETSTPTITWSTSDQQRFQVNIWTQDATGGTADLIFTSEEVVSTVSTYIMPAGWLRNLTGYRVRVTVWDSLDKEGQSPHRNFSVDYGAVVPLTNLFASQYSMRYDPCPSGILVTWDESFYPASEHEAYAIYRREATQPITYDLLIGRFSSVGQTSFLDYQPASGVEYIYTVTQMVRVGIDVIESAGVQVQASVDLCQTILSAADDGDTYRVVAQFWSERGVETNTDGNQVIPWGATKPTMMFGSAYFKTIQFTARFVASDLATLQEHRIASDQLLARRGIVCFRDPKGRRTFGVLNKLREQDEAMGTLLAVTYELVEVNYTEAYT